MTKEPLATRTMSSFPVSIGTGLMLESVFKAVSPRYDDKREIPDKVKIDNYSHHIYNVFTLARNILSACSSKDKDEILTSKFFLDTLLDEIFVISTLYQDVKCVPAFFIPDYTKMLTSLNVNKENVLNKDYSFYILLYNIIKKYKPTIESVVIKDTAYIPKLDKDILITTNYSNDLLNNLSNMSLLESHTGKLKKNFNWNSKYHKVGTRPMNMLPFTEELLYLLGDTNLIVPMKLNTRVLLMDVAVKKHWTPRTTRDKILYDIKSADEALYNLLLSYKKYY